jgi:GntR family transcriptional regulator/MocR family aminotransferase
MPHGWTFSFALDPQDRRPLFVQIASALAADITRGRLRPGQRLPGTRSLAATLGVHRSTTVAAYAELAAQGWTVTRPAAGTLVAASLPDLAPRRIGPPLPRRPGTPVSARGIGFHLPEAIALPGSEPSIAAAPGTLALWGGVPDLRLLPRDLLGRALRRAARTGQRTLLAYTDERAGEPRLRAELAALLRATRGLSCTADELFVTQGSQMALDLLGRTLLRPGDAVAVEAVGYRPAWGAFASRGARLLPIPVDQEGLDVEALASQAIRLPLRAVYLTPHHQYPTTVMLSARRRLALLALARERRFAIIEDDFDHEFHYDGRPVLPMASGDRAGVVVYVGTLAKILAPGLRVGFVVAAPALLECLARERLFIDRQGVTLVEAAVADLLEDGEVARHVRRVRREYHQRRDVLVAALRRHLPDALSFDVPPGGMALWARAAPGLEVRRWQRRALQAGVLVHIGGDFTFDRSPLPFLRLGFAVCNQGELETAVRRLARGLP